MFEEVEKVLPQIVTGILGLVAALVGYFFGRRSKVDDIRIKKTHEYAQELSIQLQEDFRDRKSAREQYELSFGHLTGSQEAAEYFDQHTVLHNSLRETMKRLAARRSKIVEVNQQGNIYLPEQITQLVDEYVELTTFTYESDGIGLIDTYAASFFNHCIDEEKSFRREEIFGDVMRRLRKVR